MHDAALLEEREERRRLLIVEAQSLLRRLARVVRPTTAENALNKHGPGRIDVDDRVDYFAPRTEKGVQRLDLRDRARETIEDHAAQLRMGPAQGDEMIVQHRDGQIIRHQFARIEDRADA